MGTDHNYAMDKTENLKEILRPGEMCITISGKLFFCFGEKVVKELNFDENVTTEKANELIQAIRLFFERK